MGEGSKREQCHLLSSWPGFQSLPSLPTIKLGPSGVDFQVGGFVCVLGPCGSLQWTLLWGWEFFLPLQPLQGFSVRSFEALFSCAGTLGCMVCLAPQFILTVYVHANVGRPSPPATTLPTLFLQPLPCWESSPPQLPISTLPTGLCECIFNSLVVRLPYSLIFWQFWLFFVFKFVVVLLLIVWGDTVYLPMPPSWPDVYHFYFL